MIACKVNPRSNRTCELGTPRCEIHHTDADLMRHAMEQGSAPSVWIEVATKYRYEFVMVASLTSDLAPLVIYRGCLSRIVFAMPADEFHQRFKPA